MDRKYLENLLKDFTIDEIEKGLVLFFIRQNKILIKNNQLLKEFVSNVNPKIVEVIKNYFEDNKLVMNLKFLERCFELLIEEKERKLNGAFYTPEFIVDYICKKTISENIKKKKIEAIKICDPACGSGAFLVKASEELMKISKRNIFSIIENNLFGVDISERSVKRTKLILALLALLNGEDMKEIKFNIKKGDSLNENNFNWQNEFYDIFYNQNGFDIIISNPPYVRIQNLDEKARKYLQLKWFSAQVGNIDLYIPFFELGLKITNANGIIGYITPNSYFNSHAGKNLRKLFKINKYIAEIIDFSYVQIFKDVTTYTAITFLNKDLNKTHFHYFQYKELPIKINLKEKDFKKIPFSSLDDDKWSLLDEEELWKIKRIENIGIPLNRLADINVGIATLSDKLYILDGEVIEEEKYYIKNYKGNLFKIEKEITKEIIKVSTLKEEKDIIQNKSRIIWPYEEIRGKIIPIEEEKLKREYPNTYRYFLAIKDELNKRDKGRGKYSTWYSFGRSQGLINSFGEKLLTSTLNKSPNFIICKKENATFYAGYSIKPKKEYGIDLYILKKILNSEVMNFYIEKTSRPYRDGYKSFAKSFIKNFSIPEFSLDEIHYIKTERDKEKLDEFLSKKYFSSEVLYSKYNKGKQLSLFEKKKKYQYNYD